MDRVRNKEVRRRTGVMRVCVEWFGKEDDGISCERCKTIERKATNRMDGRCEKIIEKKRNV